MEKNTLNYKFLNAKDRAAERKRGSDVQRLKRRGKIAIVSKADGSVPEEISEGGFCLLLGLYDVAKILQGREGAAKCAAGIRGCMLCKESGYFIKFADSHYFFIHNRRSITRSDPCVLSRLCYTISARRIQQNLTWSDRKWMRRIRIL